MAALMSAEEYAGERLPVARSGNAVERFNPDRDFGAYGAGRSVSATGAPDLGSDRHIAGADGAGAQETVKNWLWAYWFRNTGAVYAGSQHNCWVVPRSGENLHRSQSPPGGIGGLPSVGLTSQLLPHPEAASFAERFGRQYTCWHSVS